MGELSYPLSQGCKIDTKPVFFGSLNLMNHSWNFLIFLIIKISFFLLASISLIKLGYSSKVRLIRLREIEESFLYEKYRFNVLTDKFDDLFSSEGELRFMKDQDQMISRDIIRVIWRWWRWLKNHLNFLF